MEGMVHVGDKVTVEVPEGCMIVFTNDTFHAGVKSYTTIMVEIIYLIFVCFLTLSLTVVLQ